MKPQVWVGESQPSKNKMVSVKDKYYFGKPYGGFWTSPLINNTSPWIEFSNKVGLESYTCDKSTAWVLIPGDCDVFKVDNKKDIMQLSSKKVDRYDSIDYISVFEHYDALHVTSNGIKYNEFREWDCESVLWDNWKFADCIKLKDYID